MFEGWLIKASGTEIPLKYINFSSYTITPDQRQDMDSERVVTGVLERNVLEHMPSKIEFNTLDDLTNIQIEEMNSIFRNAFINELEKSLTIEYFNQDTNSYKSGVFYMPAVNYPIKQIHQGTNIIIYNSIRYAFIEY